MLDRFLEFVVNKVFSFETFMLLCLVGWLYSMFAVIVNDSDRAESNRAATEFCYSQNMVLVDSDAGKQCVEPSALVKVN
jgi:hypothetical protein